MKHIRKRITYANVMSSIAVFLVLGGGAAYAAKKIGSNEIKGNSITTGKIKKNAVTASKIKSNSITTTKIKNGAVTGPKVNVTNLAKVPSATNADNATNWSRYSTSGLKKASVGQQVAIATIGPFSFTGVCNDIGGGEFEAYIKATTSQSGSFFASDETSFYEANFDPGDEGIASDDLASASTYWYGAYGYYDEWTAASSDGSLLLRGHGDVGVKVFGADCAFLFTSESDA